MEKSIQDQILEEQRAEATKAYAAQVSDLIKQKNELESKCADLRNIINDAVAQKQSELDAMLKSLENRISEAEIKETGAQLLLQEANAKIDLANKMTDDLNNKRLTHEEEVNMHINSVKQENQSLIARHSICVDRENTAEQKNRTANELMEDSLIKESEVKSFIEEFNKLKDNIDIKIKESFDIEVRNNSTLKSIAEQKEYLVSLRQSIDIQTKINNKKEEEVEETRKSLAKRKIELDEKESRLKEMSIKNSLDAKRLQDKQKEIDFNVGKMNELKNNVEALMNKT